MACMKKVGGGGMVSLLYQCPSILLKRTHSIEPSIKHFNSGTPKGVFFLKDCLMQVGLGWGLRQEEEGCGRRREKV